MVRQIVLAFRVQGFPQTENRYEVNVGRSGNCKPGDKSLGSSSKKRWQDVLWRTQFLAKVVVQKGAIADHFKRLTEAETSLVEPNMSPQLLLLLHTHPQGGKKKILGGFQKPLRQQKQKLTFQQKEKISKAMIRASTRCLLVMRLHQHLVLPQGFQVHGILGSEETQSF